MKAALYARVSTDRQETENQLRELRDFCARKQWDIYAEYVDEAVRRRDPKPARERLYLDAHQKRFDLVVFWALDRFVSYDSRSPVREALECLNRLDKAGIGYVSFREEFLTTLGPLKEVAVAFISLFAKMEIDRDAERIKSGIERVKREYKETGEWHTKSGRALGRPRKDYIASRDTVLELRKAGLSWAEITKRTGIPSTSARTLAKTSIAEVGKAHGGTE